MHGVAPFLETLRRLGRFGEGETGRASRILRPVVQLCRRLGRIDLGSVTYPQRRARRWCTGGVVSSGGAAGVVACGEGMRTDEVRGLAPSALSRLTADRRPAWPPSPRRGRK